MEVTSKDKRMLESSIRTIRELYEELMALTVEEATEALSKEEKLLYARKDRKDTKKFDIIAENLIFKGHYPDFVLCYDKPGLVVTEERGKVGEGTIHNNTPVIISDPVDRSSYLESIIKRNQNPQDTMGQMFDREVQRIGKDHARIEACNSSVTLLKDNTIKYSIVLNLFTGEVFVAYEPGVFRADIGSVEGIDDFVEEVHFKEDEGLTMLCYTKEGKYEQNRKGTRLRHFNLERSIESPGGPNRFTYLIKEEGEVVSPIKVIAHNGEKIQESLPNIAVAFFSGQLAAYKLFCTRNLRGQRADKELAPNLKNSIYENGLLTNTGLDIRFLNNHDYPSQFRDTTVIVPLANETAITLMRGMVNNNHAIRII